jgi:trimethylamine-N-oxide reductase (cytochrome c)
MLRVAMYSQKPIEPLGEAKSELEMYAELADKLGIKDQFTEGNSEEDWCKLQFAKATTLASAMSYDDFKAKGYYVMPYRSDYVPTPALKTFYDDPVKNPVASPTGKIEIFSTQIFDRYKTAYQPDIPAVPHFIPEVEGRTSALFSKYPLQLNLKHPKFRFHGKWDDVTWFNEIYKIKGPDGYDYEPICLFPTDAAKRGLKAGDIVRVFNDRGQVLGGVVITNRTVEGVVWMAYGSWPDPLEPKPGAIDRHGNANYLTSWRAISPSHHQGGPACNSVLVEVEKANLDDLKAKYPDGWAGKYRTWVSGAE